MFFQENLASYPQSPENTTNITNNNKQFNYFSSKQVDISSPELSDGNCITNTDFLLNEEPNQKKYSMNLTREINSPAPLQSFSVTHVKVQNVTE